MKQLTFILLSVLAIGCKDLSQASKPVTVVHDTVKVHDTTTIIFLTKFYLADKMYENGGKVMPFADSGNVDSAFFYQGKMDAYKEMALKTPIK